jgi:hypothetical protein
MVVQRLGHKGLWALVTLTALRSILGQQSLVQKEQDSWLHKAEGSSQAAVRPDRQGRLHIRPVFPLPEALLALNMVWNLKLTQSQFTLKK